MKYFLNSLLTAIFFGMVVYETSLTTASAIPLQKPARARPHEAAEGAINVAGLDILRTYVCPPCANAIRRQANTGTVGKITVAIPVGEVGQLWQELQWILGQLGTILEAEGLLPTTPPTTESHGVFLDLAPLASRVTALPMSTVKTGTPYATNIGEHFASPSAKIMPGNFPVAVTSRSELEAKVGILGSVTTVHSTAVHTVGLVMPSTTPLLNSGVSEVSTHQPLLPGTTFPTRGTSTTQGEACSAEETVEETTTLPPLTVMVTRHVVVTAVRALTSAATSKSPASVAAMSTAALYTSSKGDVFGITSTGSQPPRPTSSSSYIFNSQSKQNIAVYFGQTPVTGGTTLEAQCADPSIDIVVLAFVISRNYQGEYPRVDFGAACGGQTPAMLAEAPGLLSCPELEGYIESCQRTHGKKVLLSIGGATSSLSFVNVSEAASFGNILWQLFGPPGQISIELRPFGRVSIDGFDIDNEDNLPAHFEALATSFRANYASDPSKQYYLSSAPQCPFPDASDPLPMLLLCDFVFVQFYNNNPCEIGSAGFHASLQQWSMAIQASTQNPKPRLYLGAPAWNAAGPGAYEHIGSPEGMQAVARQVQDLGLANFGGVFFWDGPEGLLNVEGGKDIISWAKMGLTQ